MENLKKLAILGPFDLLQFFGYDTYIYGDVVVAYLRNSENNVDFCEIYFFDFTGAGDWEKFKWIPPSNLKAMPLALEVFQNPWSIKTEVCASQVWWAWFLHISTDFLWRNVLKFTFELGQLWTCDPCLHRFWMFWSVLLWVLCWDEALKIAGSWCFGPCNGAVWVRPSWHWRWRVRRMNGILEQQTSAHPLVWRSLKGCGSAVWAVSHFSGLVEDLGYLDKTFGHGSFEPT